MGSSNWHGPIGSTAADQGSEVRSSDCIVEFGGQTWFTKHWWWTADLQQLLKTWILYNPSKWCCTLKTTELLTLPINIFRENAMKCYLWVINLLTCSHLLSASCRMVAILHWCCTWNSVLASTSSSSLSLSLGSWNGLWRACPDSSTSNSVLSSCSCCSAFSKPCRKSQKYISVFI